MEFCLQYVFSGGFKSHGILVYIYVLKFAIKYLTDNGKIHQNCSID